MYGMIHRIMAVFGLWWRRFAFSWFSYRRSLLFFPLYHRSYHFREEYKHFYSLVVSGMAVDDDHELSPVTLPQSSDLVFQLGEVLRPSSESLVNIS